MPRSKSHPGSRHVPKYVLHKASGQAVVRFHGKDIYLGKYGSQASHDKYAELIARWNSQQLWDEATNPTSNSARPLSIAELILRYREYAKEYYRGDGSKPGKEFIELRYALKPLRELFGGLPVSDFGPKSLALVRQKLIDAGLSRGVINRRVNRIKRCCFKWGVSRSKSPSTTGPA